MLTNTPEANGREFGISRKTGYKILGRYNDSGPEALTDRSRRPCRHANQLPVQVEMLIARPKQDRPAWGRQGQALHRIHARYHSIHRRAAHSTMGVRAPGKASRKRAPRPRNPAWISIRQRLGEPVTVSHHEDADVATQPR